MYPSSAAPCARCERSVLLKGKGRPVETGQHHLAMPGCFTLFTRTPKVSSSSTKAPPPPYPLNSVHRPSGPSLPCMYAKAWTCESPVSTWSCARLCMCRKNAAHRCQALNSIGYIAGHPWCRLRAAAHPRDSHKARPQQDHCALLHGWCKVAAAAQNLPQADAGMVRAPSRAGDY